MSFPLPRLQKPQSSKRIASTSRTPCPRPIEGCENVTLHETHNQTGCARRRCRTGLKDDKAVRAGRAVRLIHLGTTRLTDLRSEICSSQNNNDDCFKYVAPVIARCEIEDEMETRDCEFENGEGGDYAMRADRDLTWYGGNGAPGWKGRGLPPVRSEERRVGKECPV